MCYNYHRVPSEGVTIRQVLTSHKSFKNKELSYHLVRQWWSSRNPLRRVSRMGSWQKTKLAVFPVLQKVSLGMEIPLLCAFLQKNLQKPKLVGFRWISCRFPAALFNDGPHSRSHIVGRLGWNGKILIWIWHLSQKIVSIVAHLPCYALNQLRWQIKWL